MTTRKGDWIQTFTGRQYWPLDPSPDDVCIEDIAHALSNLCRFGGHCREFYSVAQHSVIVMMNLPPELDAIGLLHDASEAYCVDLPRPIKRNVTGYAAVEEFNAIVIGCRFGLNLVDLPDRVHEADNRALATEQRDLMASPPRPWAGAVQPYPQRIIPWTPAEAEVNFLSWAARLGLT